MSKGFTPQVVERMRAVSQACVDRLLDTLQDQREADLIQDLAYPFPMIMICEMLGVRPEDRARFKAWSDDLALVLINPAASPSQVAQGYRSLRHLMDYFQDLIAERRTQPKDDLLQHLIVAHEQDPTLSEDELLVTCAGLLFAGHETTTNLIGNGLLALLRHPDQLRRLQQDPALIGPAVEELLRYDGPVQMLIRLAAEDLDIGGKRIARGQLVVLMPGAANRDPEHFDQPGRLDITRSPNRQLGFGAGRHSCLGSPLGQMEAEVAITTVVRRLPGLRLAREDLTWNENPAIRGLKALPVSY
jgi:cytochrome P450